MAFLNISLLKMRKWFWQHYVSTKHRILIVLNPIHISLSSYCFCALTHISFASQKNEQCVHVCICMQYIHTYYSLMINVRNVKINLFKSMYAMKCSSLKYILLITFLGTIAERRCSRMQVYLPICSVFDLLHGASEMKYKRKISNTGHIDH